MNDCSNNYRKKYWCRVINTLRNTLDEIVVGCENEETASECQEIIDAIIHFSDDLRILINKLREIKNSKLNKTFINEETTSESSFGQLKIPEFNSDTQSLDAISFFLPTDCISDDEVLSLDHNTSKNNLNGPFHSFHLLPRGMSDSFNVADLEDNDEVDSIDYLNNPQFYTDQLLSNVLETPTLDDGYDTNQFSNDPQTNNTYRIFEEKNSTSSIQRIFDKQARAEQLRKQHLDEKQGKIRRLTKKSDQVLLRKERLHYHQYQSESIRYRLNAAENKRKEELLKRVSKARDEEIKGREIAFIQSMEAEEKQHSIFVKHEESKTRLLEIEEERKKRLQRKAELEEAAKFRRSVIESEKQQRFEIFYNRWKSISEKKANLQDSARKAAQNREYNRLRKIEDLEAIQKTQLEELQEKIKTKLIKSQNLHESALKEISRKAIEMSASSNTVKDNSDCNRLNRNEADPLRTARKWCKVCNILIDGDTSLSNHLHGPQHHAYLKSMKRNNLSVHLYDRTQFVEAFPDQRSPKCEAFHKRQRIFEKQLPSLLNRMKENKNEYMSQTNGLKQEESSDPIINKCLQDFSRFVERNAQGPWSKSKLMSLEKALSTILSYVMEKRDHLNLSFQFHQNLVDLFKFGVGLDSENNMSSCQKLPLKTLKIVLNIIHCLVNSSKMTKLHFLCHNWMACLVSCLKLQFIRPALATLAEVTDGDLVGMDKSVCCSHHFERIHQSTSLIENQLTIALVDLLIKFITAFHPQELQSSDCIIQNAHRYLILYIIKVELFGSMTVYFDTLTNKMNLISLAERQTQNSACIQLTYLLAEFINAFLIYSNNVPALHTVKKKRKKKKTIHAGSLGPDESVVYRLLESNDGNHVSIINHFLETTEVFGLFSLLYSIIFHRSNHFKMLHSAKNGQYRLNKSFFMIDRLINACLIVLNSAMRLNRKGIQTLICDEVLTLQLRHIFSHLIRYGSIENFKWIDDIFESVTDVSSCQSSDFGSTFENRPVPTGSRQITRRPLPTSFNSLSNVDLLNTIEKIFRGETLLSKALNHDHPGRSDMKIIWSSILMNSLILVTNSSHENPTLQISLGQAGHSPTILQRISRLPTMYFEGKRVASIVYTAFICLCYENVTNSSLLSQESSLKLLANFIESCILQSELDCIISKYPVDSFDEIFAKERWSKVADYFKNFKDHLSS